MLYRSGGLISDGAPKAYLWSTLLECGEDAESWSRDALRARGVAGGDGSAVSLLLLDLGLGDGDLIGDAICTLSASPST